MTTGGRLFLFPTAVRRDPAVDDWFEGRSELGALAKVWFDAMRKCGDDVRELLHDGHPTACVGEAAFGYVNAFAGHVNLGFFRVAELPDPNGLLQGTGKFMRHVKLKPIDEIDTSSLNTLIKKAYADIRARNAT